MRDEPRSRSLAFGAESGHARLKSAHDPGRRDSEEFLASSLARAVGRDEGESGVVCRRRGLLQRKAAGRCGE